MKKMLQNKTTRTNLITYLVVVAAFVVMQTLNSQGALGSSMKGYLIPIFGYNSLPIS